MGTAPENTVVHPRCIIENVTEDGVIYIGRSNILEETCHIMNHSSVMKIGDYNRLRMGSTIGCTSMGSHNVIDVQAQLLPGCVIENHCVIRPKCTVHCGDVLPDNTCTFGTYNDRIKIESSDATDLQERIKDLESNLDSEIDALRYILPVHHETYQSSTTR